MIIVLLIALAGGLGAAARFAVDTLVRSTIASTLPLGTIVINVSGSFLLGLITGLTSAHLAPASVQLVLGTGLLGGYTTFSTASLETVRLVQDRRIGFALLNAVGTLVVTVLVATLGYAIAVR